MKFKKGKKLKNWSMGVYFLTYSSLFFLICFIGYKEFNDKGISFIWKIDGYSQHFPTLVYLSHYYREIINNLIQGNFSIPLYDFSVGTGENIIGVLNYYGLGDVLLLLTPFVKESNADFYYKFLILLRMFLSGLSFSYFCFYMRKPKTLTLIGAISYVFCGFAIFSGIRHPYFLNPMILLPLLFVGLDKVLKSKKPFLFIGTVLIGACAGFYFFYMETIMIFIYGIIRYMALYRKEPFLYFVKKIGTAIGYYLLGICLSGAILFPALELFFSSSRASETSAKIPLLKLLFYSPIEYGYAYVNFISAPAIWSCIGMTAITMLAVIVLFCKKRKVYWQLQIGCVIGFLLLLIPFGGYAMNGFSYVANRWSFAFAFLLAYIITCMIPGLLNLGKKEIIFTGLATIAYTGVVFGLAVKYTNLCIFAVVMLWGFFLVCLFFRFAARLKNKKIDLIMSRRMWRKSGVFVILFLVIINCIANIKITNDKKYGNYVSHFLKNDTAIASAKETSDLLESVKTDADFYRVDATEKSQVNEAMIAGYNGVSAYFSLLNKNIPMALTDLKCSPDVVLPHRIEGVDERTILETLLRTKYFTTSNEENVPYGFEKVEVNSENKSELELYENKYVLPFGYTYSSVISQEEYQKKSALEKQEMLLQAAVIKDESLDSSETYETLNQTPKIKSDVKTLNYSMKLKNIEWTKDGTLKVSKKGATIKLNFQEVPNSETYLVINGLDSNASGIEKFNLKVRSKGIKKSVKVASESYNWYTGNKDYVVNLGYSKEGKNSVTIRFPRKGEFQLDNIRISAYTFQNYEEQVNMLKKEALQNVVFDTNKVTGTIEVSQPKLLCMAMEYDKGWSVYVDGKKADTCMVDGMFLGVMLEKGQHQIECKYMTPGLPVGIVASFFGIAIVLIILVRTIYKKRGKI